MRIGIVAVHGVIPQLRFGFQDEVAAQLTEALNAPSQEPAWTWTVVLPSNGAANAANVPTISRVHQVHDDPAHPASDFFDVHEAFWSPIDKGKTTFASICAWLLKTVFAPLNSFARYREHPLKVCWDLGYVLLAFAIAVFLLLFAAMQSANGMLYVLCQVQVPHAAALKDFAAMRCPAVWAHGFDWSVPVRNGVAAAQPSGVCQAHRSGRHCRPGFRPDRNVFVVAGNSVAVVFGQGHRPGSR